VLHPVKRGEANGAGLAGHWRALTERLGTVLVAANALTLMLAAWTPGNYVVRTGFSGHVEHAIVYALSGAFLLAVLAGRYAAWQVAALLAAYAGLLEAGQLVAPGRHAAFGDFAFSAAGAIAGVLACAALHRRFAAGSE
jgi:VanZ family protein